MSAIIMLPIAWLVAVLMVTAALPIWHEATSALAASYPALVPLLGNPIQDVFFIFILPTFLTALAGFSMLR